MSTSDFDKEMSLVRLHIEESREIRSEYYDLNEISGLSDILGIAKKIGSNFANMAKNIGGALVDLFKGIVDVALEPFRAAALIAIGRMLISTALQDKAVKLGIPEAILATPCAFWLVDLKSGGLQPDDALTLIRQHGSGLPKGTLGKLELAEESFNRGAIDTLFESWSLLAEDLSDYSGKDPNDWVVSIAQSARSASQFAGAKNLDTDEYSDEDIAHMLISSALTGDEGKDESLLAAAYGEVSEDDQSKYEKALKKGAEKRWHIIQVLNRLINAVQKAGNKPIHRVYGKGLVLTRFRKQFLQAADLWKRWPAYVAKNDIKDADPDALSDALTKFVAEEIGKSSEDDPDKKGKDFDTQQTPRELIAEVFIMKEWYVSVWNSIGKRNIEQINQLLNAQLKAPLGNEFAKFQGVQTISEINATPEFKKAFEQWMEEPDNAPLVPMYEFAIDNNNDEILSRLASGFRPVLIRAFGDHLRESEVFKNPTGKYKQLIDTAVTHGYKPEEDPGYEAYIQLREKFGEELIKTYDDAAKSVESAAKQALEEIPAIFEKAKGGDGAPGLDVEDPAADIASGV